MLFKNIPGHQKLKEKFIKSVKDDRVAHAQLILGTAGSAAFPLALAYAQYVNCLAPLPDDSCSICSACKKYNQLIHPDLHFSFPVKGAGTLADEFIHEFRKALLSNPYLTLTDWMESLGNENSKPNITALECRNMIRKMDLRPYESKIKVLIIWMPEYLGKEGNILLKMIEEPKGNSLILLCGESENKLLGTIMSRVQLTRVPAFNSAEVKEYLLSIGLEEEEKAQQISLLSNGDISKALFLMQHTDNLFFNQFRAWMLDCYKGNTAKYDYWIKELSGYGREKLKSFFEYGLQICRACLVEPFGLNNGRLTEAESQFVQNLSKLFDNQRLSLFNELLNESIYGLSRNGNAKILIIKLSLDIHSCLTKEKVLG